jgi:cytoskeletal protein CcmA (bactofilin family)
MFSKTADPTSAPPATGALRTSNAKSVLAQDLRITGEITSSGTIEILGEVDGTIHARGLTVGPEGRVSGTVTAEVVEIKGKLDGKVASQSFTLRAAAEVVAEVTYTTLVIESGASIEGKFAMNKA